MKDSFGREIEYMRVSVTDRCNLRCVYCMPKGVKTIPAREILTFEEIRDICSAAASLGIKYIRLTGGEPLVRLGVERLAEMIKAVDGIEGLTLTTNGVLLEEKLPGLVRAGLDGVNISLDTLDRELFRRITGFDRLDDVKKGIKAALDSGVKVKLNTVIMEENRNCLTRLAELAKDEPLDVRFIEMMPIGEGQRYGSISGEGVFSELEEKYGRLEPCFDRIGSGPARYYSIDGFEGRVGFINAVHGAFCGSCNRIRLTYAGFLKTCLCYEDGADLKAAVRRGDLGEVRRLMAEAVKNKPKAHHFALGPAEGEGGMNRIGG